MELGCKSVAAGSRFLCLLYDEKMVRDPLMADPSSFYSSSCSWEGKARILTVRHCALFSTVVQRVVPETEKQLDTGNAIRMEKQGAIPRSGVHPAVPYWFCPCLKAPSGILSRHRLRAARWTTPQGTVTLPPGGEGYPQKAERRL